MNNIIDNQSNELDSRFNILTIDHQFGLVLESRSGVGRNTQYNQALEVLLERLKNANVKSVRIKIVSQDLLKHFSNPIDRTIIIDGVTNISLVNQDTYQLRRKIARAMAEIKIDKSSKGGNPTKRIQIISNGLGLEEWKKLALGEPLPRN